MVHLIVVLHLRSKPDSGIKIAVIPAGFRPAEEIVLNATLRVKDNALNVAAIPNGDCLLTIGSDNQIRLWDFDYPAGSSYPVIQILQSIVYPVRD